MVKKVLMEDIKYLEGLEIFLGYSCTQKCNFCFQKDLRLKYNKSISKKRVIKLLADGYNKGKRFIIFSGGEPTLNKSLGFYIKYSKEIGYKHIRVHSNGFRISNYYYLLELYNKGLTGVIISVHGYNKIHDKISGVNGSFKIILKALLNLERLRKEKKDFLFDTNTVISKDNYKTILQLIQFLSKFSINRGQIVLSYSLDLYKKEEKRFIIPKYKDILPYLEKVLSYSNLLKTKFVLENIPFCVISKKYWNQILNNIKINKSSITLKEGNVGNTNFTWMLSSNKCSKCIMKADCRGIPRDYYEIYGDKCLNTIYN